MNLLSTDNKGEMKKMTKNEMLIHKELNNINKALNVFDKVIEVVKEYEGKTFSKRFDTALKKIDNNIRIRKEFNSFDIIYCNYSIEDRYVNGAGYIKNDYNYIAGLCVYSYNDNYNALSEDNKIVSENIITSIERQRLSLKRRIEEIKAYYENEERLKLEKEEIEKRIKEYNDSIPYLIDEYYKNRIDTRYR